MAVVYEVTSGRACTIDGLGLFEAGKARYFSAEAEQDFVQKNGVRLAQARFPHDVQVTVELVDLVEQDEEEN